MLASTNNIGKDSDQVFSISLATLFKIEEIQNIQLIWLSWPITSVIYWIIPVMTWNMLL